MKGKWRIVKMPDYTADYPDMVEPAYIQFDGKGGGEFAFGCVTGAIHGAGDFRCHRVRLERQRRNGRGQR